jgi:hypothetical protein
MSVPADGATDAADAADAAVQSTRSMHLCQHLPRCSGMGV